MANDVIALAMRQAAAAFGGTDGVFNAAGFGHAMYRIANLRRRCSGLSTSASPG